MVNARKGGRGVGEVGGGEWQSIAERRKHREGGRGQEDSADVVVVSHKRTQVQAKHLLSVCRQQPRVPEMKKSRPVKTARCRMW